MFKKKRSAGRQLIKGDDGGTDEETATPQGGITKASTEVLKGRRIIKARKKRRAPSKATGAVNPFAALAGLPTAAPANPFGGLAKLEKPLAPAWSPTAVKMSSGGFSDGFTLGGSSADGAAVSSSASGAPKPLAAFSFNVGAKVDSVAASAPAASAPPAMSFNFGSAKPLGGDAAKAPTKSPTFAFSAAKSPAATPQPLKSATSTSSARSSTGGASSKRARLKSLNAKFAKWVAAQLASHPSADWSAAATEYAGFVRKIRTSAAAASGGAGGAAAGSASASAASSAAPASSAAAAAPAPVDGEVFVQLGVLSRFQDIKVSLFVYRYIYFVRILLTIFFRLALPHVCACY